ncbi:MAG TPA: hypothetical protein VHH73_10030, partial [Verrucomicrobiae bacterium]|nr:hypothetical protein [Verrucomicrobiae bacterium]
EARRLFVKFDAWLTHEIPLIREAFPDVPWIFLYREPEEVLVSHQRMPGLHMVPGEIPSLRARHAFNAGESTWMQYRAQVLGSILEAGASQHQPGTSRLVHYRELPDAVFDAVTNCFGLDLSPGEIAAMQAVTQRNAKRPLENFQPDREGKQSAVDESISAVCASWATAPYQYLEILRARQPVCHAPPRNQPVCP